MMRVLYFSLLCVYFFAACKKWEKSCPSDDYTYTFSNNAKVDTTTHGGMFPLSAFVATGNKKVFKYMHVHAECPDKVDGISVQTLFFEADPMASSFAFTTDDLAKINCYFRVQYGGGGSQADYIPNTGTIEGTKINGQNWKMKIDLILKNNIPLTVSGIFTPG